MNKVIILTNYSKWADLSLDFAPSLLWDNRYRSIPDVHILQFGIGGDGKPELNVASSFAEEAVYLVFDKIPQDKLASLLNACPNDHFYVLAHRTRPSIPVSFFGSYANCFAREGSHTSNDSDLYYHVFEILFSREEEDNLNRIIRFLYPPLETILLFLNECLTPGNAGEGTPLQEYYEKILLDAENDFNVKNAVQYFYEHIYPGKKSLEEYESDLCNLRGILIDFSCQ